MPGRQYQEGSDPWTRAERPPFDFAISTRIERPRASEFGPEGAPFRRKTTSWWLVIDYTEYTDI